jgi:putative restriction endonuclease
MPAAEPSTLVNSILRAIQISGGIGVYISTSVQTHPRIFRVQYIDQTFSLWVYIWTLTPGGRRSLPNEYRIQMTSVDSPLLLNNEGYSALLGYFSDLDIFAGFDLQRHHIFTTGSPSVQININTIHQALQDGLAFSVKNNGEIAVGIRPDQFINYILNAEQWHQVGNDIQTTHLLQRAARLHDIEQHDITRLPEERQKIISNVNRYSRAANFSQKVLSAYDNRCAITRAQLMLVDAAHILPVPAPGSNDEVSNGVALSPTMHRAFDNGLIYLDEDLFMRLDDEKVNYLTHRSLTAGLIQFRNLLNLQIHLPADHNSWPNPVFIRDGNKYRHITGYY